MAHHWNGNPECRCNQQDVEKFGHCDPTNDCECCDSQPDNTIDDQIMDLFMEAAAHGITPKQYTDGITNLIAQEANKAKQQLLTELLGELPKKMFASLWDGGEEELNKDSFNEAIDQVVSVIQSKIGELNG